jgi:DNA-binding transcriptional ArsR family regulator
MDDAVCRIAAAIAEPARARMLYSLMDNRARTSTELAAIGDVSPSTASVHLSRLLAEHLVSVQVQGKHRYYRLQGVEVAGVLESLNVLAGGSRAKFVPNTPTRLRTARTCYDHIAGTLGVSLHDQLHALGWISAGYDLSPKGAKALADLGADIAAAQAQRRRFAYPCLDWSERRSHIGGALGSVLLKLALKRRWVTQDLDSRALSITNFGSREMLKKIGVEFTLPHRSGSS